MVISCRREGNGQSVARCHDSVCSNGNDNTKTQSGSHEEKSQVHLAPSLSRIPSGVLR